MIKSQLVDGHGTKRKAKIDSEGALNVVVHPHPPVDEDITALPFRQFFTDTGLSTGSSDMAVNGGTTPQLFYISASIDFDIYINSMSVIISDQNATLDKFGALNATSFTGTDFYLENTEQSQYTIANELKTNFDFIRFSGGRPAYGNGATAFIANNISGNSEGITCLIDFSDNFGLQYGVRLQKGSTNRLVWQINDNVSGVDAFNIIAYGIRI